MRLDAISCQELSMKTKTNDDYSFWDGLEMGLKIALDIAKNTKGLEEIEK